MFFSAGGDDDDGDFSTGFTTQQSGGKKLASLFGLDQAAFEGGNESLKYKSPKQPTKAKDSSTEGKTDTPSVLVASAVHTFRYVNGQYVKQGKLGAAVLGSHTSKDYKILLYVSQKQPVAAAKITSNFSFTVQKNNYAIFYDDQQEMWSICFDNTTQAVDFGKWIGLAKFNCSPVGLASQDLVLGDGQSVQIGDMLEVQYTGWLLSNHAFGKVFDTNRQGGKLFKFKVGKGKVIKGWEEGSIGIKKGGKRLLVVPSGLAYGSKGMGDRIPPNATLIFELDITRAKFANPEAGSNQSSQNASRAESPVPSSNSFEISVPPQTKQSKEDTTEEKILERSDSIDSVKSRTLSISEQLLKSSEMSNDKAKLLARMSKMGHAMVAPSPTANADVEPEKPEETKEESISRSEHEEEDMDTPCSPPIHLAESPKPNLKPKPENEPRPVQSQGHSIPPPASYYVRESPVQHHNPTQYVYSSPRPTASAGYQQPVVQQQQPVVQQPIAIYQPPQPQVFAVNPMQQHPMQQHSPMFGQLPTTNPHSSAEISLVITESKLQHGEMKSIVSKVSERVEDLISKVEKLEKKGHKKDLLTPIITTAVEMEASVLSNNISRILQENDKLKRECSEKTTKIETLSEKISDLLTRNQSFLEKSNQLMEERADSIRGSATQALAKVTTLEQQSATLSSELGSTQAQVLKLHSDLEAANKREEDLTAKLTKAKDDRNKARERLESESAHASEHQEEIEQLRNKLKEEKQQRKKQKVKIDSTEEEFLELKQENESLEKAVNEKKKKQETNRKKFEAELEELKNFHEEEIKAVKQRYKKGNILNEEKISEIEADLESKHAEKLKKTVSEVEARWTEKYDELLGEKNAALKKLSSMENKLVSDEQSLRDSNDELKQRVDDLERINQDMTTRLSEVHHDHKRRLEELLEEKAEVESEAYKKGLAEGESRSPKIENDAKPKANIADEVKKVMNGVFFKLKSEFEPEESYTGREVITEMLATIKAVTLKLVSEKKESIDDEESEEDDDEEDEEEENEDEEDEEEDNEDEEEEDENEEDEDENEEDEEEEKEVEDGKENVHEEGRDDDDEKDVGEVKNEGKKEENGENNDDDDENDDGDDENDDDGDNNREEDGKDKEEKNTISENEIEKDEEKELDIQEYTNKMTVETEQPQTEVVQQIIEATDDNYEKQQELTNAFSDDEEKSIKRENVNKTEVDVLRFKEGNNNVEENMMNKEGNNNVEENMMNKEGNNNVEENVMNKSDNENAKQRHDGSESDDRDDSGDFVMATDQLPGSIEFEKPESVNFGLTSDQDELKLNENKEKQTSLETYQDKDDEDDDFLMKITHEKTEKSTSVFSRSPPPLFDDDDDDVNWI